MFKLAYMAHIPLAINVTETKPTIFDSKVSSEFIDNFLIFGRIPYHVLYLMLAYKSSLQNNN